MAWADTLQNASFRGLEFDVERVDDTHARSVAVHEFPFRDGGEVEDLGTNAKSIRFTAVLFSREGDGYENRLQALLAALQIATPGQLVHPVFGSIPKAVCTRWTVQHDAESRDGCRIQLEFLESRTAARVFAASSPVLAGEKISATGNTARSSADSALVQRVDEVADGSVQRRLDTKLAMNSALAGSQALSANTATPALMSGLDPIFEPTAYCADMRAALDAGLAGLAFGGRNLLSTTSSFVAGNGMLDFERAVKVLAVPAETVASADVRLVKAHARVHAACTLADAAAIVLAAELEEPLLDRADVERVAAASRGALQAAIEALRAAAPAGDGAAAGTALRALAYQVQAAAVAVLEQRPPVVLRAAPLTGPLRLVAHALYGDHTRATELARLNRFGATLVAEAGQELRAYAS